MTSSNRRPLSRGEKRLLIGGPLLLLLAVGIGALYSRMNARAEIKFPQPVPMPNPNGFDVYVAAANAITPAKPAVDAVDDAKNLSNAPALAAQRYSLARKTAWLKANSAGFALFEHAKTLSSRTPPYKPPFGNRNYSKLRQLARDKKIEANTFGLQGDWNGYLSSSLDIVQLGTDIDNGGGLLTKLVGDSIEAMGTASINVADDPIAKLNLAQARAATQRLEAILMRRQGYLQTMENERWNSLAEFDWLRKSKNWRRSIVIGEAPSFKTLQKRAKAFLIPESEVIAAINRRFDEGIADLKQPYSAPTQISNDFKDNPITALLLNSRSYRQQEGRSIVPLNVLLLRLALRTYQLENGKFSARLNELSPKYLTKIPRDYFADNVPFHYAPKGKTYLLYSVGPDGRDDKGTPIKWRNGKTGPLRGALPPILPDSQGDYVAGANR